MLQRRFGFLWGQFRPIYFEGLFSVSFRDSSSQQFVLIVHPSFGHAKKKVDSFKALDPLRLQGVYTYLSRKCSKSENVTLELEKFILRFHVRFMESNGWKKMPCFNITGTYI